MPLAPDRSSIPSANSSSTTSTPIPGAKNGGQFKLEIGTDDLVRISDKWGRGVVFQRHHSEVKSRLTQKDLAYFDRLYKRMQVVRQTSSEQTQEDSLKWAESQAE